MRVSGFTLIELIIAITLISIIATLTLMNASFVHRFAVRSEVEKFASTCRYLQQLAMSTNREQHLTFDLQNNSYAYNGTVVKLSSRVQFGIGNRPISGPPSAPTKPITHAITYAQQAIVFYPDGIIQSGIVYFSDTSSKYVYAVSTPVSQISFVRTYVYDGTWNLLK